MKIYKVVSFLTLVGCFSWMQQPVAANDLNFVNKESIDKVVERARARGFVGIVSISSADQLVYGRGVGDAVQGRAGYTTETVVDIASVSKQFTGAAIVKLEQEKRLSLNDTLDKYFPSVGGDKGSISLHQLLTHTAGFKRHIGRDEEAMSKEAYIDRALTTPLLKQPGQGYHYSNVGYSLLAVIIEMTSGQSYEDYLYSALWQPAAMFETGYFRPDWSDRIVPKLGGPHAGLNSALEILQKNGADSWHLFGNGGVLSTSQDMMKWHRALLGNSILSVDSKEKLFGSHVPEHDPGYYYGYGWSVVPDYAQGRLVWHNGMSFFGKAEFWRFPESGLAIFVASHSGDVSPWSVADELAVVIHGDSFPADK